MNPNKTDHIEIRDKSTRLKITIPITEGDVDSGRVKKYQSGGGTPNLVEKLNKEYTLEITDKPKSGTQAKVDFARIRTISGHEVEIVRKKEQRNSSVSIEQKISCAIKEHPDYKAVKSSFCLPFYKEARISGDEVFLRRKKADLEIFREYLNKHFSDEAATYLFHQTKKLVTALDFLHNSEFKDENGIYHKGIVHGDIKPDNILVDKEGNLSLADFGCAHFSDEPIYQPGMLSYLSPELLRDVEKNPGEVLPESDKADIWSLGVTMNSLITEEYPIAPPPEPMKGMPLLTMSMKEKTNTSGYIIREEAQQSSFGYVIRENAQEKTDYVKVDSFTHFFSDNSQGRAIREKKAIEYLNSEDRVSNYESKKIIDNLCQTPSNLEKKEIFRHLTSAMLLSQQERPSAKELKETMAKLSFHFSSDKENTAEFEKKMFSTTVEEKRSSLSVAKQKELEEINRAIKLLEASSLNTSTDFKKQVDRIAIATTAPIYNFWETPQKVEKEKTQEKRKAVYKSF